MFKPAPDALPPQVGIKRYFFVQKYSFAAIGIDPTSLERTVFNRFLAWIPMMTLLTLCFPMLIYASQYVRDLDLVTDALSPVWQSILAIMKLLYFMYNKNKIVQLVRKIWMFNLKARNEELEIIAEENRKDTMFSIFFYSVVFVTGILALGFVFIIALFYYLKGYGFWNSLEVPLKGAYLISPKTFIGYIFAYAWNVAGIYFVINGTLSTDTLFSWFIHNVSAQFRILNLRLKTVAETLGSHNDDEVFRKIIIKQLKYHSRVIQLAHEFNDVFMVTVFIKFAISFLQIACLAFQFSRGGEFASQLFHFSFLVAVSLQLILYCYGGQRIKDESTSVSVAIYDYFKWHDLSIKSKKLLLLPIMRAQRPCDLTGVFFVADLSLFLWVFKTAGSFITMLMAMEDKE